MAEVPDKAGRTIYWGGRNPLGDPRLQNLVDIVHALRNNMPYPPGIKRTSQNEYENKWHALPTQKAGYYKEYSYSSPDSSNKHRIILGKLGEVFISGNHYNTILRVEGVPAL
jgi:hypothetical protein